MNLVTRRQAVAVGAAGLLHAADGKTSRLSLEGYIWQNVAAREKKPLAEMLDDLFAGAPYAGFKNIELNHGFFTPALRDRVIALTRKNGLLMPSVYVGGGIIANALEIGGICKEFQCTAVVNNPDSKPQNALKTDAELALQANLLNRMGRALADEGLQLRIHHHAAEMLENAREWRHIFNNTDPKFVSLCIDLEHAHRSGVDPDALLREAGNRVTEIHLRNKKNGVPLEDFGDGDIDHAKIAATLRELKLSPLVVIELAYHSDTVITRDFRENLRLSRLYAERTFGL